jgi:hypothetical protein
MTLNYESHFPFSFCLMLGVQNETYASCTYFVCHYQRNVPFHHLLQRKGEGESA